MDGNLIQESQKHGAASDSVICIGVPFARNDLAMAMEARLLQWRRGTNKDETAALSGNRPQSLCDIDCISCACDCCTSAVALATVAGR